LQPFGHGPRLTTRDVGPVGLGHGLDLIEPFGDGRFLRVGLLTFFPESLPFGRSIQSVESNHLGHESTGLSGPEVGRFNSASLPFRLVIVSTAVDGFPTHFYPTPPPAPRFDGQ
jgi:hypothetical protein